MSQKSFLDNKNNGNIFHMLGGWGVNPHMENSICFVVFIFESFPNQYWQQLNMFLSFVASSRHVISDPDKVQHTVLSLESGPGAVSE